MASSQPEQAAPQSALEPTPLGEFIEVVVRVPIDRHSDRAAVMGVPDDHTHRDIAAWVHEEYPSPAGFIADWCDQPGSRVAVRIRAKDNDPESKFPGWMKDEFINIWGGEPDGAGAADK